MTALSAMIVESAKVATKNHKADARQDLGHMFVCALYGQLEGTISRGDTGEGLQVAHAAVQRLYEQMQSELEAQDDFEIQNPSRSRLLTSTSTILIRVSDAEIDPKIEAPTHIWG